MIEIRNVPATPGDKTMLLVIQNGKEETPVKIEAGHAHSFDPPDAGTALTLTFTPVTL